MLPWIASSAIASSTSPHLAPDKHAVFREMHRVLRPGGRIAISDIALKKELPPDLAQSIMAYVGCIAGAIMMQDYERGLRDAGFAVVQVVDTASDLNAYAKVENQAACCSPAMDSANLPVVGCCSPNEQRREADIHSALAELLKKYNVNHYAASVQVYALKKRSDLIP
jgi:SAM-dependent methyltransferase